MTHNPVWLAPDDTHPLGRCLSTGGYHNSVAAPAIDGIAGAWADLCLICLRLCAGLMNGRVSGFPDFLLAGRGAGETDGHGAVGYLPMAIAGFLEEARAAASPTFVSAADASVFGQDDVSTPAFLAWSKCMAAGRSLDSALAVLAVAASQALHVMNRDRVPDRLADLLSLVRGRVPPVDADRVLGPEMQRLAVVPGVQADRAEPLEKDGVVGKLGIDATTRAADRPDWTRARPPEAVLAKVRERIARRLGGSGAATPGRPSS